MCIVQQQACRLFLALFLLGCLRPPPSIAQDATPIDSLAARLRPFLQAITGRQQRFEIRAAVDLPIDGETQSLDIQLARFDQQSFDLQLTHSQYAAAIRRRKDATALALPKHDVVFLGRGDVSPDDHLTPQGLPHRLITTRTTLSTFAPMILQADSAAIAGWLTGFLGVSFDSGSGQGTVGQDTSFRFDPDGSLRVESDQNWTMVPP